MYHFLVVSVSYIFFLNLCHHVHVLSYLCPMFVSILNKGRSTHNGRIMNGPHRQVLIFVLAFHHDLTITPVLGQESLPGSNLWLGLIGLAWLVDRMKAQPYYHGSNEWPTFKSLLSQ